MNGCVIAGTLSALRWRLCSHEHAARVAARLTAAGEQATVARGRERLQPWRVVEGATHSSMETTACA